MYECLLLRLFCLVFQLIFCNYVLTPIITIDPPMAIPRVSLGSCCRGERRKRMGKGWSRHWHRTPVRKLSLNVWSIDSLSASAIVNECYSLSLSIGDAQFSITINKNVTIISCPWVRYPILAVHFHVLVKFNTNSTIKICSRVNTVCKVIYRRENTNRHESKKFNGTIKTLLDVVSMLSTYISRMA